MNLTKEELSFMELAFLFKMPLYKLLNEMPYQEYLAWIEFFKLRPPGVSEDYRAAMIIAAFAPKAPLDKIFPSLQQKEASIGESLKKSSVFAHMLNAKGGDAPKGFYEN
jgi:hypothetical protein